MDQNNYKFEALIHERKELRDEILEFTRAMNHTVFGFVTVLLAFGGIYWSEALIPDAKAKTSVLVFLSQVEVFLALFSILLGSNAIAHARYIAALERKINAICGEAVNIWETYVSGKTHNQIRFSFVWTIAAIVLLLVFLFIFVLRVAVNSFVCGVLAGIEALIVITLLAKMIHDSGEYDKLVEEQFKKAENDRISQPGH